MVQKLTIKAANKAPRVITATNGATQTLTSVDSNVVIYAPATLASQTIVLPDATGLVIGKEISIGFAAWVTSLSLAPGDGNSFLVTPPTSAAINSGFRFVLAMNHRWCMC